MKSKKKEGENPKPSKSSTPVGKPARKAAGGKPLKVPPILLEGDASPPPAKSGPGQRFSAGTTPSGSARLTEEPGELPEAYGTEKLLLAARDPHWLYAHWDMTREQLHRYNRLAHDGHLTLRIYKGAVSGQSIQQVDVHPESRTWFVPVPEAGVRYCAQLGYLDMQKKWVEIATSSSTLTPSDRLSENSGMEFSTLPAEIPFEQLLQLVQSAAPAHAPLAEAIRTVRPEKNPPPQAKSGKSARSWTAAEQKALAELVTIDATRRVWMGSLEITEVIRRQLLQELSSAAASQFSMPGGLSSGSSLSSGFGGNAGGRGKGFWFNVNAELVIYGATEADAKVTIGGRKIQLRPDGTFSFRFILPDGEYNLPVAATSADGDDTRRADLHFSRATQYKGHVDAHPQDPALKVPDPAHVA